MSDFFGTPAYGQNGNSKFKKKVFFSLDTGDEAFRILPPMFALREKNVWSRYFSVNYGYKNMAGKMRSFLSTQAKKDKVIVNRDAALDRLNTLKEALEKIKLEPTNPQFPTLFALVGQGKGHKPVYNVDNNHHMWVVDLNGTIGILKLKHKTKVKLDNEIDKLRAEGIDPLSVENGRFFVFNRVVAGRDTDVSIKVYKEKVDVPGFGKVERDFVHSITPDLEMKLRSEVVSLDTLYQVITAEEVAQIVAESDLKTGKSPACDRIFDARWKAEADARKAAATPNAGVVAPLASPVAPKALPAALETLDEPDEGYTPPAVTATVKPVNNLPTTLAVVAKAAPATVVTVATPQTQAQYIAEQPDKDFFASIGVEV